MQLSAQRHLPTDVETSWKLLNDPAFLKDCIRGCESIERISDTDWRLAMAVRIGPVAARFSGRLTLGDLQPPTAYTLSFEGQGGAAGFGKGSAKVRLSPAGSGSLLDYTVNAEVGGKLAQIGSRLVDAAARKMAEDFFSAFDAKATEHARQVHAAAPGGLPRPIETKRPWLLPAALGVAGLLVVVVLSIA
ncbi:MAG: carbon monoxide dehydrogenase subunit G [Burkholderiaceae bacterium]